MTISKEQWAELTNAMYERHRLERQELKERHAAELQKLKERHRREWRERGAQEASE